MASNVVQVVLAWHEALNAGDLERLLTLSSEDVEVGGPRGSGHGRHLLREWFGRAGITLIPKRWFERDALVVVEQGATWSAGGDEQTVASLFEVTDSRVSRVVRYEDASAALNAAGIAS
jgi:ketosteroid isomerase-like protein